MNSRDISTLIPKLIAAGVAMAIALTGAFTGLKWLTFIALLVWIAAMYIFGRGDRNQPE
jgi:hypothetical protein